MQIDERVIGNVTILDIQRSITLGEGDEMLKDKINEMLREGRTNVILNMAKVPYIDSSGLMEIVRAYTNVSRQGGNLKILNLTERVKNLFDITRLASFFEIFGGTDRHGNDRGTTEYDAVRSFQPDARVVPGVVAPGSSPADGP